MSVLVISSAVVRVISEVMRSDGGLDGGGSEPVHEERLDEADEEEQVNAPLVPARVITRIHLGQDGDAKGLHLF